MHTLTALRGFTAVSNSSGLPRCLQLLPWAVDERGRCVFATRWRTSVQLVYAKGSESTIRARRRLQSCLANQCGIVFTCPCVHFQRSRAGALLHHWREAGHEAQLRHGRGHLCGLTVPNFEFLASRFFTRKAEPLVHDKWANAPKPNVPNKTTALLHMFLGIAKLFGFQFSNDQTAWPATRRWPHMGSLRTCRQWQMGVKTDTDAWTNKMEDTIALGAP